MLAQIRETVTKIWDFLNQPFKIALPEESFLARLWKFLTSPMPTLSWEMVGEFFHVCFLVLGMVSLILYMLGARGRIAKCLYWCVALSFVISIL